MTSIKNIKGVNGGYAEALAKAGIHTTEQLIEAGSSPSDRMHLCDETNISDDLIKKWVHHADLFRIEGIRPKHVVLLCNIDVCTVPKLAYKSAENLLNELSQDTLPKLKSHLPSIYQLESYISKAKKLPKVVHH